MPKKPPTKKSPKTSRPDKSVAVVTIHDGAMMSIEGRKRIGKWLRSRATLLEKHGDLFAKRFTARYLYS